MTRRSTLLHTPTTGDSHETWEKRYPKVKVRPHPIPNLAAEIAFAAAEERLEFVLSLGVLPFAMLYRDQAGKTDPVWRKFQKYWCRPAYVGAKLRQFREQQSEE